MKPHTIAVSFLYHYNTRIQQNRTKPTNLSERNYDVCDKAVAHATVVPFVIFTEGETRNSSPFSETEIVKALKASTYSRGQSTEAEHAKNCAFWSPKCVLIFQYMMTTVRGTQTEDIEISTENVSLSKFREQISTTTIETKRT